jgi:hypothetical protein
MNPGIVAFLIGLFVVPIVLLWWGHRLRRLDPRRRRAFWGAIVGHLVAGTLAIAFGLITPEAWTAEETMRGFFGLWALLLLPVVGGVAGALTNR